MGSDFEDIFPNKSLECSDFKGKLNIELSTLTAIYAGDREIKAEQPWVEAILLPP